MYTVWNAFLILDSLDASLQFTLCFLALSQPVVTGSSYGIGKFYATELAKRKMNVVLVSRSEEKLKEVARGLGIYKCRQ